MPLSGYQQTAGADPFGRGAFLTGGTPAAWLSVVEEGENALAEMDDSGFNSGPTSILAKTKASLEGLERGTEVRQACLPRGGRADKPGSLERGMF